MNNYKALLLALLMGIAALSCTTERPERDYDHWAHYGGSPSQSKFFRTDRITKENVGTMEVAWIYPTADNASYYTNPLIVDSVMYVMGKNYSLIALNLKTQKELWIHTGLRGIARRGFNYWESEDGKIKRILFTLGNSLQAIDAVTGKSVTGFGQNGYVDLRAGLDRDPTTIRRIQSMMPGVVYDDLIILGSSTGEGFFSPPGHIRAYNVLTGQLEWIFHTIPHPGEFGYDTWPKDAYKYIGGTNVWSEMSVDTERGIVYLPIGSPTFDFYGADRTGSNLFGNSLVALDAKTGERIWHYQTVHHDLWDYDLSPAPQLITVTREGKVIEAVAVATKHGFVFVFDRETGEPVFPIEEKPFPPSNMPEEEAWSTQPISSLPSFTRHEVTKETLNPYFPDSIKQMWYERLDQAKTGLFVPPSDQYETIMMPGALGGANYGNTGSDPDKGILFVMAQEHGSVYQLKKVESPAIALSEDQAKRVKGLYEINCQACHGTDMKGGSAPALEHLGQVMFYFQFREVVTQGRGRMPGFIHLDEERLKELYLYLGGNPRSLNFRFRDGGENLEPITGPVVDSGGIEMIPDEVRAAAMTDYPEGVDHPENRYTTDYGTEWTALLGPPWSYMLAYDLNNGSIKWKQVIGEDSLHVQGDPSKGAPGGVARKGMVVTSTGVVFVTAKGGKLYALDADSGSILWETTLSNESNGQPSMFTLDGKEYLVINATSRFTPDSYDHSVKPGALPKGYVVYTLPDDIR